MGDGRTSPSVVPLCTHAMNTTKWPYILAFTTCALLCGWRLHGQAPSASKVYRHSIQVDLAAPCLFLATMNSQRLFRVSLSFGYRLPSRIILSVTTTMEYMRQVEEFEEWWYYRWPYYTNSYRVWINGLIRQKQLSLPIGIRWKSSALPLGKTSVGLVLEPRIAPFVRWGYKMAYLVDGSMDYDVKEFGISPRLRLGLDWEFHPRWSLCLQGEMLSIKYMGVGRNTIRVLPVLDLRFRF
jgi:hypothetical protein